MLIIALSLFFYNLPCFTQTCTSAFLSGPSLTVLITRHFWMPLPNVIVFTLVECAVLTFHLSLGEVLFPVFCLSLPPTCYHSLCYFWDLGVLIRHRLGSPAVLRVLPRDISFNGRDTSVLTNVSFMGRSRAFHRPIVLCFVFSMPSVCLYSQFSQSSAG